MTLYEKELQKMIRGIPFIQRYTLAGNAVLGSLGKNLRVKISFVAVSFGEHCDAIKLRVINRKKGDIDAQIVKFRELLEKNLFIDSYDGVPAWGPQKPVQSDYVKLNQFLHNYLSYYAPKQKGRKKQC